MDTLDATEEWRRLTELYRQMTDEELLEIAKKFSELTDAAQPILAQEIKLRGLEMPREEMPPPPPPEDPESVYAEDRKFVDFLTVWSLRDAMQVQSLLDTGGIPFLIGLEKATGVDRATSNFTDGVIVQVMRVGLPWAKQALAGYEPQDIPESGLKKDEDEDKEYPVRCPKCNSTEVIFGSEETEAEITAEPRAKFDWTCDSCGYQWEDDGVVKEV